MNPRETARRIERALRGLRHERFIALDERGEIVCELDGDRDSVIVPPEIWPLLKDRVCTHNHPGGWAYPADDPRRAGNSFSLEDLELACRAELREMRAVTPSFRYVAGPPPSGWNEAYYRESLKPAYLRCERETERDLVGRVRLGSIRGKTAEASYYHEIMLRLSRESGLRYGRER